MIEQLVIPLLLSFLAGFSTVIGSVAALLIREFRSSILSLILGFSVGVMIFISFVEFLRLSIENIGFLYSNIGFFLGVIAIYLLDTLIPHVYKEESETETEHRLDRVGMMVALGIAIHNVPEGIAVLFSSLSDIRLGVLVALAIALHNIPEGIGVAIPIYYSRESRKKAFWYSFLSGMAEPLGLILGFFVFYPFIDNFSLNFMFSVVAGIMVFISFDELLPACFKFKKHHFSIIGLFIGMFVMSIGLYLSGTTLS